MKTFVYNRGLAPRDPAACRADEPAITLDKVTHIDLDNVLSGLQGMEDDDISVFMTPDISGFIYLRTTEEVVNAYRNGQLYVMSGNF